MALAVGEPVTFWFFIYFLSKVVPNTARLLLTQNWNDCVYRIAKPVRSASTSAACPSRARPSRSRTAASSVSRQWPSSPSTSPTSTTSSSSTKRVWVCRKDIRSDSRLVFRKNKLNHYKAEGHNDNFLPSYNCLKHFINLWKYESTPWLFDQS